MIFMGDGSIRFYFILYLGIVGVRFVPDPKQIIQMQISCIHYQIHYHTTLDLSLLLTTISSCIGVVMLHYWSLAIRGINHEVFYPGQTVNAKLDSLLSTSVQSI